MANLTIDRNKLQQIAEDKAVQHALKQAKEIAERITCAEHGSKPTVRLDGKRLAISGCCDDVRQKVLNALKK